MNISDAVTRYDPKVFVSQNGKVINQYYLTHVTYHSAPCPPGTRYATLGTPMGIIVISSRVLLLLPLVELRLLKTPLGPDENDVMPFFGTNVDTVFIVIEYTNKETLEAK